MSQEDILTEIAKVVVEFQTRRAKELIRKALDRGIPPLEVVMDGLAAGLDVVGKRYEDGEYFLPELVAAGTTAKESLETLEPYLKGQGRWSKGSVIIGTVQGDLHDIGKNIVSMMLLGAGLKVKDLGVDVPASKFLDDAGRERPDILALSCLLTTAMPRFSEVVRSLEDQGLRKELKILVGGNPVDANFARSIGADGYAPDALQAMRVAKDLIK